MICINDLWLNTASFNMETLEVADLVTCKVWSAGIAYIECNPDMHFNEYCGPSEIGTVYNKPLYKGHCLRSQKLHAL